VDHIIAFFSAPTTWDIGHINSWIVAAFAYAVVVLFIARFVGTNGKRASEDMITAIPGNPYGLALGTCPQCATEDRYLSPTTQGWYCLRCCDARGVRTRVDPNSPMAYSQPGTKRTFTDVDMDDPDWSLLLDDALDEGE
jgi:hypothetical protein